MRKCISAFDKHLTKHVLYTVYADAYGCVHAEKPHNHISINFARTGKMVKCGIFFHLFWSSAVTKGVWFFLLRCYCREPDHHVGDYPYNAHGNLKWNMKSLWRQQCWLNSSNTIVQFICRCPRWSIDCRGEIPPQDNMLEQPQICERDSDLTWIDLVRYLLMGRGGTIKIGQFLGPSDCRERI